ncbi:hexokinase [Mycena olivaceomarginata]|nr:hexokinase [Mycena olivaceomarginata]
MQQNPVPATEDAAEAQLRKAKGYSDGAHAFFKRQQDIIETIHNQFNIDRGALITLAEEFHKQFQVSPEGKKASEHIMLPSFIPRAPDGSEEGTYYGLELRGTCAARLHGAGCFDLKRKKYDRPNNIDLDNLKVGEDSELFNWLAKCVYDFLVAYKLDKHEPGDYLPLGFTFPFPVLLTSLKSGTHLKWAKGYSADNSVGEDVVGLLQIALEKQQKETENNVSVSVKCVALVNDTVSALLSQAYKTRGKCNFGAVFGRGTNCAYLKDYGKRQDIVNTEWGSFNLGTTSLLTKYDTLVKESAYPTFEMMSGMYLGQSRGFRERLENISVDQMDSIEMAWQKPRENLSHDVAENLRTAIAEKLMLTEENNAIILSIMSAVKKVWEVDRAWENPFPKYRETQPSETQLERRRAVQELLADPKYLNCKVPERDAAIIRWASSLVVRRAALLSGVAVATVLIQAKRARLIEGKNILMEHNEPIVVAVDGSNLFSFYSHFKFQETLRESLRILVGDEVEKRVKFETVGPENRLGAALAACIAEEKMN